MFNHIVKVLVNKGKMFNADKVEDCIVAQVAYTNGIFTYTQTMTPFSKISADWKRESGEIENIVIVLESPHHSEYDKKGKPLRPAMGNTGEKLKNGFEKKLTQCLSKKQFQGNKIYNLWLVNAIQYQCSLGIRPMQKELKNTMFRLLWKDLQDDFKDRIKEKNPIIIVNLCTGGKEALAKYIKNGQIGAEPTLNILAHNAIEEIKKSYNLSFLYFYGLHPSSRGFVNSNFTEV